MQYTFIIFLLCTTSGLLSQKINIAGNKRVYGNGVQVFAMTDGDTKTAFRPTPKVFPYFFIDLGSTYDLTEVEIDALDDPKDELLTLSISFNVYTWDKQSSICELEENYPFKLCKESVKFSRMNETIKLSCNNRVAKYIIFATGKPDSIEQVEGPRIGELRAYGTKIMDPPAIPSFESDSVATNVYKETRKSLFNGIPRMSAGSGRIVLTENEQLTDVVFLWEKDSPFSIAGTREIGRLIIFMGNTLKETIERDSDQFTINLRKWLGYRRKEMPPIVPVESTFTVGDILLITCTDTFDVNSVYDHLIKDVNPLVLHINQSCFVNSSPLLQLTKKLQLKVENGERSIIHKPQVTKDAIDSMLYVPLSYYINLFRQSWQTMKERLFRGKDFVMVSSEMLKQIESTDVQTAVRNTLSRYRGYFSHYAPCDLNPLEVTDELRIIMDNYAKLSLIQKEKTGYKLPGVNRYPGQVTGNLKPTNVRVTIKADRSRFFMPTGAYANPGEQFTWRVIRNNAPVEEHFMAIGCVTDDGFSRSTWYRWNLLAHRWPLTITGQWNSPVGGPIYIHLTTNDDITVELNNVYRYPWLDVRAPDAWQRWEREKLLYAGVPRIHIVGDMMHSCVDTYPVSRMTTEDLRYAVTHYDNAAKIIHNYRGTDWRTAKFEIFTTDIQLSSGMGHAGYPFMIKREWTNRLTEVDKYIKQGGVFGLIHEMGHNLQVQPATLRYGTEVTNVVYYLPTHRILLNLEQYEYGSGYALGKSNVANMISRWEGDQYNGVQLSYYGYLGKLFGEGLVGNVWSRILKIDPVPRDEMDKIMLWLTEISQETGYNLIPFHKLWNFPTDLETERKLSTLPCYLPNDEIIQLAPESLINNLLETYKTLNCTRAAPEKVIPIADYSQGINHLQEQFVFFEHAD